MGGKNGMEDEMSGQKKKKAGKKSFSSGSVMSLVQATGLGLWKWDVKTGEVWCNRQMEELLGYPEGALAYLKEAQGFQLIYGPDQKHRGELMRGLLTGKQESFVSEERMLRQDGRMIWVQEHCAITQRDSDGSVRVLVALTNDITDVKRAEKRRQEETRHWESMAHMVGIASWVWDIRENYIAFNKEFEELLGYSVQEMHGSLEDLTRFMPQEDLSRLVGGVRNFIQQGARAPTPLNFRHFART